LSISMSVYHHALGVIVCMQWHPTIGAHVPSDPHLFRAVIKRNIGETTWANKKVVPKAWAEIFMD
jgi:hypothetical protein